MIDFESGEVGWDWEEVRNRRPEPRRRRIELGGAPAEGGIDSGGGARLMTNIASIVFHRITKNVTFSNQRNTFRIV